MAEKKPRSVNLDKLTFEQAIEKLRAIVEKVESGDIGLEESIDQYEVGCKLIKRCRTILNQAEQRIETLSKDVDGKLEARPADDQMRSD